MNHAWNRLLTLTILFSLAIGAMFNPPGRSQAGDARLKLPGASTTERVSLASDGTQGDNSSTGASISSDGRYVAFSSTASNLVSGDTNGVSDVFVHDRQTGETRRVSVASNGTQGNNNSWQNSISPDGRYVAFASGASNLVSGDTNGKFDIFVHDRQTGETTRVSVDSHGAQGNDSSNEPCISADGRYIIFASWASNLVTGDTNGNNDIFVHERLTGETTRVSVSSDGIQGNAGSLDPAISSDGRYAAFESYASNLVSGDTNGFGDIFVHDMQTGETTQVSVASNGTQGNSNHLDPSISSDGRFVSFGSYASTLVSGDTNGYADIFVHDRQTGETTLVSIASDGTPGDNNSYYAAVSLDGQFVAFTSYASNLATNDTNGFDDNFIHNWQTGETTLVSVSSNGMLGDSWSTNPSISSDGRYVTFQSKASNLVEWDTNGTYDVFVHDRGQGAPAQVDLDVSTSTVKRAHSNYHTKQSQSKVTVLETSVTNLGPGVATQVSVQFYAGDPATGTLIASSSVASIAAYTPIIVRADWEADSSPASADIYVKVSAAETDVNPSNNISSQGTPAYVAFANYAYDPDTFKFENWKMTWLDFLVELGYYNIGLPPGIWLNIVGPFLYALTANSGHCYGMSQASIIYWDTPSAKPLPLDTFDMERFEAAMDLHDQHVRQLFYTVPVKIAGGVLPSLLSPSNAYQEVKKRLSAGAPTPAILDVWLPSWHSIVAYKVVEIGGEKVLYVYDNNDPMPTDPSPEPPNIIGLDVDKDQFLGNNWVVSQALASDPVRDRSEITAEMIEDIYVWVLQQLTRGGLLQGFFSWGEGGVQAAAAPSHFLITDSLGNRLGYDQGVLVNEILGAEFNEFDRGFHWRLPADGSYSLKTQGAGNTGATLSFAIPLSNILIQETVYTGFDLPPGATVTTTFSQATQDWLIQIDGQPDVTPIVDRQTRVDALVALPLVIK